MKKSKRKFNAQLLKEKLSYTALDLAQLFKVHIQTVFAWHRDGLKTIDKKKPYMFYGLDVKQYLKGRNEKLKMFSCALDELPCFTCRAPRKPMSGAVSYYRRSAKVGLICAPCSVCQGICQKAFSYKKLRELETLVSVRQIGEERLSHPDDYGVMNHISLHGQPKRKIARKNFDNEGQFNLFYSKDKQKEDKK